MTTGASATLDRRNIFHQRTGSSLDETEPPPLPPRPSRPRDYVNVVQNTEQKRHSSGSGESTLLMVWYGKCSPRRQILTAHED